MKNKLCLVDGSCPRSYVVEPLQLRWNCCNAVVKAWILNSVSKDLLHEMIYNPTTRYVWEELRELFSKIDGTHIFHLVREIYHVRQGTLSIANFFGKLKMLWHEIVVDDEDD